MTDTPKKSTATTARRPDCVTEVRRGNTVRLFQTRHYRHRRRQDDESAGSGKRSRGNSRTRYVMR